MILVDPATPAPETHKSPPHGVLDADALLMRIARACRRPLRAEERPELRSPMVESLPRQYEDSLSMIARRIRWRTST
jgi:hypothetical protein